MTDYVDISLDSETWAKRASADLRSLGACIFDIETGHIGDKFHIAVDNPLRQGFPIDREMTQKQLDKLHGEHRKYNLLREEETVEWWYSQPHDVWMAFENPVDLRVGCERLAEFILSHSNDVREDQAYDVRMWGHGAGFDPPIIEYVFHAVGVKVPWFYRAPRDTRTAFDWAGIENHSAWLKDHQQGILHHAMWDSISQAGAISDAFGRIPRSVG